MKTFVFFALACSVFGTAALAGQSPGDRLFIVTFKKAHESDGAVQVCDDTYYKEVEIMISRYRGLNVKKILNQCPDASLSRIEAVSTGYDDFIRLKLKNAWNCNFKIEGPLRGQKNQKSVYEISLSDAC